MSQQRRQCLFCGGYGTSREHIIARWIGRALTLPPMPGVDIVYRHRSENPEAGIAPQTKHAKGPAYFSLAFCRGCNETWMSRLENDAREVLEPLLLDRPRVLSPAEQRLLAFWVCKTVLAFQSIEDPATTFARPVDFTTLYRLQAPLSHAQIWLGANDHGEPAWYRAHSIRLDQQDADEIDGFGATLTIGFAVFYVLAGFTGRVGLRLRYDPAMALKEIWPGRGTDAAWPPPLRLPGQSRQPLAEYLARNSVLVGA